MISYLHNISNSYIVVLFPSGELIKTKSGRPISAQNSPIFIRSRAHYKIEFAAIFNILLPDKSMRIYCSI